MHSNSYVFDKLGLWVRTEWGGGGGLKDQRGRRWVPEGLCREEEVGLNPLADVMVWRIILIRV